MHSETSTMHAVFELDTQKKLQNLFDEFYTTLVRFANSYLEDVGTAENIVQDAFVAIWEKRTDFTAKAAIKSYLYTVTRNRCLNQLKHTKVKQQYQQYIQEQPTQFSSNADETVRTNEIQAQITSALNQLPEKCQLIFKMSRYEHKKYQEIADTLQISIKTVEAQMGKALKIMRVALSDYLVWTYICLDFFHSTKGFSLFNCF